MVVQVERVTSLSMEELDPLVVESEQEGYRFLRGLADEWGAGLCRLDRPGEGLFVARSGRVFVGVGGLSADPYVSDSSIGRLRRLYVLRAYRGRGIGTRLVQAIVDAAQGQFRLLRLRAENREAGRSYERLGFVATPDEPDCTHDLRLSPSP